ncbi:cysteine and histidine-rich domain-containing protein 1-like [Amphiura filiformis]|uniref:cysteine and histidine-rich domain-containing protein 1-like n=1 Tax=Amphiura filiformis TaxID=82378 RepID=UPI003B21DA25
MANAMNEMTCYNKGCGQQFVSHENHPAACSHHPGDPIDHHTDKGWSCCEHRTTEHEEFVKIPGCSKGSHNSEKPSETPKE